MWIDAATGRWCVALVALALGLWLRNCVFLAASPLFALAGFYQHMDGMRGARPLLAASRCIVAGITAAATAIVMIITLLTGVFGFWPLVDVSALLAGGVLAASGLLIRRTFLPSSSPTALADQPEWLIAATATLALGLAAAGAGWVACLFAGAALATTGMVGWHLARDTATALLRAGSEP